jgi:hypothetical protein
LPALAKFHTHPRLIFPIYSIFRIAEVRGGICDKRVTSVLVGASKVEQLKQNIAALNNLNFADEELDRIDKILKSE